MNLGLKRGKNQVHCFTCLTHPQGYKKKGTIYELTLILFKTTIKVNFDVNYRQFNVGFVFALMKCSYAAFGEQNKIDNYCKCQQVYKSPYI